MNIGIHFFDMLHFLFGNLENSILHFRNEQKACGFLEYERAEVKWFLSIDPNDIPANVRQKTYRSIKIEGEEIEFSGGFTDLHTISYQKILVGDGFGLADARQSIQAVEAIRNIGIEKPKSHHQHEIYSSLDEMK